MDVMVLNLLIWLSISSDFNYSRFEQVYFDENPM